MKVGQVRCNAMSVGRVRAAAAMVIAFPLVDPASAEIHDYMIRRLLYLGTACGVDQLERLPPPTETTRRFKALCRNVSAYPEGIFVTCTDIADDRSCKVETAPKSFDSLNLMRPADEADGAR